MASVGGPRPPWIDRRLQELPTQPMRKIHLDFHNTPAVGRVGAEFDAAEFVDTLQAGHVDSIVVFAKDMHGYFYYPSARGPVHPGLDRDLLGEQVAACRAAGIRVSAYYCVTWDNYLADRHPEWLVFKRDRTTYLPNFDEAPSWTALCLSAPDFVEHVLADSAEILQRYDLDGMWYDMPLPIDGECFCFRCLSSIRAAGGDPMDIDTQRADKQALLTDFMRQAKELVSTLRPGASVDQNNQTRLGLRERAEFLDNIDIEALPTGGWGYHYYPVDVRQSRNYGTHVCGLTGRFHVSWADFGGLKHPRQLDVEVAGIVAQGAHCSVGDQPGPSGRLDRAVYDMIGVAYGNLERREPYVHHVAPVVEAAIVAAGPLLYDIGATVKVHVIADHDSIAESVVGMAKLLRDTRIQFDVIDDVEDFSRYRLLVVPEAVTVTETLATALRDFVDGGGSAICAGGSVGAGAAGVWWQALGITREGTSPFSVPYLTATGALADRFTSYPYALYGGSERWRIDDDASVDVLADLGEPAFERGPQHFTSHKHSPFDHLTGHAVAVVSDRVGAVSFPLGSTYLATGYWVYRELFRELLDRLLPDRLLRSDAPAAAEMSLTQQRADNTTRWLLHVVNTSTDTRWGPHLESYDEELPLHDLAIAINLPGGIESAHLADSGAELVVAHLDGIAHIVVPRVSASEIVVLSP